MKAITSNKWVLLLVIFLVLTNLALVFFAFSTSKPAVHRREQKSFMSSRLNLTEEQEKIFKQKKEEYFAMMKPEWEQVNNLKDSLYQHIGDEQVPDSLVSYYVDKWTENSRQSDKKLFYHFRELRTHCTKDQQAVFDTLVPKIIKYQAKKK